MRFTGNLLRFAHGYACYLRSGTTPWESFMSMRSLYCTTNGRLNDLITSMYRWFRPNQRPEQTRGILGTLSEHDVVRIVSTLDRDGCCVLPGKVPAEICDQLMQFALSTPMNVMAEGGQEQPTLSVFDPHKPRSVRYDCEPQVLMENAATQLLVSDPGFRTIAQAYLRTEAVQDLVALWWSTSIRKEASAGAAQLYHFDLDRVKFLKFFVYLTDVGPDNGPHCFIRGSHKRKPRPLRRMERISDEEIFQHYPRESQLEISGPQGTIIIADTAGFHKGKPLAAGNRLMFQIEFAIDLFGYNYPRIQMNERFTPSFRRVVEKHPYTFGNYAA
jgi:hypothetical protein